MTQATHDCKDELNELNLRATPTRLALINFLESTDAPVDVQTMIGFLKKENIKTDPATVFRIVNLFSEKGLIKPIQFNDGKLRYEYSEKTDHHHFVCESCGKIEDISDCNIELIEREIKKRKGLLIKSHSLEFFGLCKNCQK